MIYLIMPGEVSTQLMNMANAATADKSVFLIKDDRNIPDLTGKKILFAVELNTVGHNTGLYDILSTLYKRGSDALKNSTGAILIRSESSLYTKSMAKSVLFSANQMGCSFIGHPLVEATEGLRNFITWQKKFDLSLEEISYKLSGRLGERLWQDQPTFIKKPKIVVLHSSSRKTSNTLMLWNLIKNHLVDCEIEELHVENGTVLDCIGCPYSTCKYLGLQNSCFYGGFMIKEILPAVEKADAIVWICPNYNDTVSANLIAVINRLTALYRKIKFYDKRIYSVVVSANSGGDSVSKQLIDALTINKGFRLPPYFSIMEIANDPGTILKVDDINKKAEAFANNLLATIKS
ncbi:MAG: NAD(P)H-dependent oxidoreductase [Clostridiaceae bacterium]|nr:NAD(P)H-dependent oxidoreductase [Clostridiaceae bacterium]